MSAHLQTALLLLFEPTHGMLASCAFGWGVCCAAAVLLQVAGALWASAWVGSFLSLWWAVVLAYLGAFTVPFTYQAIRTSLESAAKKIRAQTIVSSCTCGACRLQWLLTRACVDAAAAAVPCAQMQAPQQFTVLRWIAVGLLVAAAGTIQPLWRSTFWHTPRLAQQGWR